MRNTIIALGIVVYVAVLYGLVRLMIRDAVEATERFEPKVVVPLVGVSVLFGYLFVELLKRH